MGLRATRATKTNRSRCVIRDGISSEEFHNKNQFFGWKSAPPECSTDFLDNLHKKMLRLERYAKHLLANRFVRSYVPATTNPSPVIRATPPSVTPPNAQLQRQLAAECRAIDDGDGDRKKKGNDDDKEKMMSVVTKTLMWMIAIYMLVGFLTMVVPNKNRPETATRYVSWHEFVHHMLAVGEEARKRTPCIIYIDEVDAIGRQRDGGGSFGGVSSGESEQTLNQLLVEMDGIASKEGVLMLASTNRADILDKALLRPGRFDRHILIDLPNLSERREIFEKHLSGIKLEATPDKYAARLATLTPGFSGADIANVCNEAALHAARTSQKVVTTTNLEYAVERLVGGTEKRSHALSHAERRVIAFHESGHALVGWLLPHSDVLLKVTIVPRTTLALGFAQYTPREQKLYSQEQLFDKMCMALGGRAAENLTFDRITTGAQNDLEKVTKMAYAQIKFFGMNRAIGPLAFSEENDQNPYMEKPYSKALGNVIDREARRMITEAYEKTEQILRENAEKLSHACGGPAGQGNAQLRPGGGADWAAGVRRREAQDRTGRV
ncbi:hypothetical protein pipiens_015392 [Culex pipiens pipiens]|uniref:Paraplegin n=1 Tax=Culex pipiens pipiens TaxID=38569 RepID=A0ABD1CQM3_CULPP